jgi:hypothetical protein
MAFKSLVVLSTIFASSLSALASNPKRGIAFIPGQNPGDIEKASNSAISWEYNWQVAAPNPGAAGVEHVPMQWGSNGIDGLAGSVQGASVVLVSLIHRSQKHACQSRRILGLQ